MSTIWPMVGWLALPNTDSYHFSMPLFWRQHETLSPYLVGNPRLISVVFASETICLPGVLYSGTVTVFPFLTWLISIFAVVITIVLAKSVGASKRGALGAGAVLLACSTTAITVLGGSPDVILSALWFGASLYFLIQDKEETRNIALSVMFFVLACGAKNSTMLQAPAYLLAALVWYYNRVKWRKVILPISIGAIAGLLFSGMLWSYISNQIWFGNLKGDPVLQGTISGDWSVSAVWTRLLRAGLVAFADPMWLPESFLNIYRDVIEATVSILGGSKTLSEDGIYYQFGREIIRPNRGLGWMGLVALVPSAVLALFKLLSSRMNAQPLVIEKRRITVMLIVTVGSFLTTYAVLRTQPIGLSRLMLSSILPAVVLSGLLLSTTMARRFVAIAITCCILAYTVLGIAQVGRQGTAKVAGFFERHVFKNSGPGENTITYNWIDAGKVEHSIGKFTWERAFHPLFAETGPATLGYIWDYNAEELALFGPSLNNRLIALSDCRTPSRLLPAATDIEYIILISTDINWASSDILAAYPSFTMFLDVDIAGTPLFKVLRRRDSSPEGFPMSTTGTRQGTGYTNTLERPWELQRIVKEELATNVCTSGTSTTLRSPAGLTIFDDQKDRMSRNKFAAMRKIRIP